MCRGTELKAARTEPQGTQNEIKESENNGADDSVVNRNQAKSFAISKLGGEMCIKMRNVSFLVWEILWETSKVPRNVTM